MSKYSRTQSTDLIQLISVGVINSEHVVHVKENLIWQNTSNYFFHSTRFQRALSLQSTISTMRETEPEYGSFEDSWVLKPIDMNPNNLV